MPVRKLLYMARVEAAAHGRGSLPIRIGEEPLQHAPEGAVVSRDLEHFADLAGARVVEIPADEPRAFVNGACAQPAVARLARSLLEQPRERARVVVGPQRVAVCDLEQVGEHRGRVERLFGQSGVVARSSRPRRIFAVRASTAALIRRAGSADAAGSAPRSSRSARA